MSEATELWSEQAEMCVLGAPFVDSAALSEVRGLLSPDDFHRPAHRLLYRAMCSLDDAGEAIDPVTLTERLQAAGELERAGGHAYVSELLDAVPTAANVEHHARIVRDRSRLRQLAHACQTTVRDVLQSGGEGVEDVIREAEERILGVGEEQRSGGGLVAAADTIWPAMEAIEKNMRAKGGITGVPTGIPSLDRMTAGLQRGQFSILAGRPSMGKSALASNIMTHAASRGHSVVFLSIEMTEAELVHRAFSSRSGVELNRIRRGLLDQKQSAKLSDAASWLSELPIWIDDEPGRTVPELRSRLHRHIRKHQTDLVIVDHMHKMHSGARSLREQMTEISADLAAMAKRFDVPLLALGQLSRAGRDRPSPRPRLTDLRESGSLEQDAGLVLLLWRPEAHFDDRTPEDQWAKWEGKGELIVAKQRNGPTGKIRLHWDKRTTTFTELEERADKPWRAA